MQTDRLIKINHFLSEFILNPYPQEPGGQAQCHGWGAASVSGNLKIHSFGEIHALEDGEVFS